ncbi:MAG: hypothetical protein ACJAXK_003108 [Yoonia sp.]
MFSNLRAGKTQLKTEKGCSSCVLFCFFLLAAYDWTSRAWALPLNTLFTGPVMKITALILCFASSAAQADITATFRDGAPVDQFTFNASDDCLSGPISVIVDLSGSQAGLIFDITSAGMGVEVFQPFVLTAGQAAFSRVSEVNDGDQTLTLDLTSLTQQVAFTIDLDDTIGQREITVSGAEIAGASVTVINADQTTTGVFDTSGNAVIMTADCGS